MRFFSMNGLKCLLVWLSFSPFSLAQSRVVTGTAIVPASTTQINFEEAEISGLRQSPGGFYLQGRSRLRGSNILPVRRDFRDLVQSESGLNIENAQRTRVKP